MLRVGYEIEIILIFNSENREHQENFELNELIL